MDSASNHSDTRTSSSNSIAVQRASEKISYRVLFIGNSHTFYENLPWVFTSVCRQAGIVTHSTMITHPGVDWRWHLSSSCVLPNIRYGGYNYVVIQQRSHPFDGSEALIEQGLEFFNAIKDANAIAVLMNTWSEQKNRGGQKIIDGAFLKLHSLCQGSLIAKCGPAWDKLRGVIDLYADDGEHQNVRGAYLNACVLAKTIFGIDPIKLPPQIESDAISVKLMENEIRLLQITAAEV